MTGGGREEEEGGGGRWAARAFVIADTKQTEFWASDPATGGCDFG